MQRYNAALTIDLDVVQANLNALTRHCPTIMPMVKANAYGTDAATLTRFFQKCDIPMVGVSHVNEGIALRDAGITMPIFVISAPPFEAEKIAAYRLEAAVSTSEEVQALSESGAKANQIVKVHVDVNTGLNRFGASGENALILASLVRSSPHLQLNGMMTHFAVADAPQFDSLTRDQITLFKRVVGQMVPQPKWIHAANSPGLLRFPLPFCNLARIGISLFGFAEGLELALSLHTHLVAIRETKLGEAIGYGGTYQVKKEKMRIGVLPVGYHDGLHRHYSGKGHVLIHGKQADMVGRICMDFMMIDLSEIPEAKIGDQVTLFGKELPPETVATWGGTDVRELIACIGPRVKRLFSCKLNQVKNVVNHGQLSNAF